MSFAPPPPPPTLPTNGIKIPQRQEGSLGERSAEKGSGAKSAASSAPAGLTFASELEERLKSGNRGLNKAKSHDDLTATPVRTTPRGFNEELLNFARGETAFASTTTPNKEPDTAGVASEESKEFLSDSKLRDLLYNSIIKRRGSIDGPKEEKKKDKEKLENSSDSEVIDLDKEETVETQFEMEPHSDGSEDSEDLLTIPRDAEFVFVDETTPGYEADNESEEMEVLTDSKLEQMADQGEISTIHPRELINEVLKEYKISNAIDVGSDLHKLRDNFINAAQVVIFSAYENGPEPFKVEDVLVSHVDGNILAASTFGVLGGSPRDSGVRVQQVDALCNKLLIKGIGLEIFGMEIANKIASYSDIKEGELPEKITNDDMTKMQAIIDLLCLCQDHAKRLENPITNIVDINPFTKVDTQSIRTIDWDGLEAKLNQAGYQLRQEIEGIKDVEQLSADQKLGAIAQIINFQFTVSQGKYGNIDKEGLFNAIEALSGKINEDDNMELHWALDNDQNNFGQLRLQQSLIVEQANGDQE